MKRLVLFTAIGFALCAPTLHAADSQAVERTGTRIKKLEPITVDTDKALKAQDPAQDAALDPELARLLEEVEAEESSD